MLFQNITFEDADNFLNFNLIGDAKAAIFAGESEISFKNVRGRRNTFMFGQKDTYTASQVYAQAVHGWEECHI
jgi:hypothetical protein